VKHPWEDILLNMVLLAKAMVPGAIGAAVSVAVQQGLTWLQRFVQFTVGLVVGHYAGAAATELLGFEGILRDAVMLVAGLAAFETAKALRTSFADVAREAPKKAFDWWLKKWDTIFPSKK